MVGLLLRLLVVAGGLDRSRQRAAVVDLDYDVVWCAAENMKSADLLARVFPLGATLREPESEETIEHVAGCFTHGKWTFVAAPDDRFDVATAFPDRTVLKLHCDATNSWSTLEQWKGGELTWSVYGAADDDYVRVEGDGLVGQDELLDATVECETVPLAIARNLTGYDTSRRPKGLQIVVTTLPRELRLPGGKVTSQPAWEELREALANVLATESAWLTLVVGEGGAARRMTVRHGFGELTVDIDNRVLRPQALEVEEWVRAFASTGEPPAAFE